MKKKPATPLGATEEERNPHRLLRAALIVAVYLLAFIILDFITKQFEGLPGIVAWYPPAGLTYSLLLVFGVSFTPAVTIALFISSLFTYRMPQSPYLLLLWAFVISLIYGLGVAFLRKLIRFDCQLRKLRDVAWFVCTTVLVSALLAVLSVSSSALSSAMPRSDILRAIFDWWIGETVGVLTVTPFLLIFVMPALKRFVEGQPIKLPAQRSFPLSTLSVIGQAASIVLVLYLVFGTHVLDEFHPFFLISLPLIWIALQRGFKGISVALLALNSGVVLALWLFRFDPAQLGELELLMIVNCIVGLLMGAVVTERRRTEQALAESEIKFRWLYEYAPSAYHLLTPDANIMDVNRRWCELLGYGKEEVLGKAIFDFMVEEERQAAKASFEKKKQSRQPYVEGSERNFRTKGGAVRTFKTYDYFALNEGQNITSVQTTIEDITERKRAEQEIFSLAKFPSENPAPVLRLSRDGIVLYANPASEALLDMWGCTVGGSAPQLWRDLAAEAFMDRKNKTIDLECEGKIYSIIFNPVAEMEYLNLYGRDVTERRQAEEELVVANKELVFQNEEKEKRAAELVVANKELVFQNVEKEQRAVELSMVQMETVHRLRNIEALRTIDQAISSSHDLSITFSVILEEVTSQLKVDAVDVLLLNLHTQTLEFAAGQGFRTDALQHTLLRLGEGYAGRAALERQFIHIPDLRGKKTEFLRSPYFSAEDFVTYYVMPLIAKGELKGVLEVFHRSPYEADTEWRAFFETLAGQTAIAIDNFQLFEGLQRSTNELSQAYDATIEGWSYALDLRDKETEGHSQRVTKMTLKLAHAFDINEADLVRVRWGALLHDIGKMGVPDYILLKPGPLTDEEWVLMKKHPTFAYEMLSSIHYLKAALDIPYCHHEKWDGTGYPRGLKGKQIPLAARIFAVVDVWDAMKSDRPYRPGWTDEKVREHIRTLAGTHFDPQVVEVFLKMEDIANE